ncbi:hypothetical protein TRICI_006142 [Trichomonascus ciferrii]|uniref:Uncharacterized protein n=1 Tax=Trichomonascus ciferrii TaxID=44093 RepID=A0A642UME9_9ASCO|nr:hypothetical protein TRICI_006142 [Trichomonascus ciferrii]
MRKPPALIPRSEDRCKRTRGEYEEESMETPVRKRRESGASQTKPSVIPSLTPIRRNKEAKSVALTTPLRFYQKTTPSSSGSNESPFVYSASRHKGIPKFVSRCSQASQEPSTPLNSERILQILNQSTELDIECSSGNVWSPSPKKHWAYYRPGGWSERIQDLASREEDLQELEGDSRRKMLLQTEEFVIISHTRLNRFCHAVKIDDGRMVLLVDVTGRRKVDIEKKLYLGPPYIQLSSSSSSPEGIYLRWEIK